MTADRISFDRAAEYYDRTRSAPESTRRKLTEILAEELAPRGRVLEIGVGTGRIALPLDERGIALAGLDVSMAMMSKLLEKTGRAMPFPLVQGDALRLPFTDGAFGAAFAVHVLHLIPDWRGVLGEMVRVVRPGGAVMVDQGHPAGRRWREAVQRRFERETGVERRFSGLSDLSDLDEAMAAHGATLRLLPSVGARARSAPEQAIAELEEGLYSWTWQVDPEARRRAGAATRAWARERWGDVTRPRWSAWRVQWRAYDLPRVR